MIEPVLLLLALGICTPLLGTYMARALSGGRTWLSPVLGPVERALYRLSGIHPEGEMRWVAYAVSVLVFGFVSFAALYAMLLLQALLPFNPQHLPGLRPDTAFNVAMSFVTNTDWQSYSGEATLSYCSQMAGLAVQNFFSAGVGLAVAVALFRAFTRKQMATIGNFWVDLTRAWLYVLLPMALLLAVILASQGVVQTFEPYVAYVPLEQAGGQRQEAGGASSSCLMPHASCLALGPVASQAAIKMIGSNGGGFFNANAAHPFENPTPLANFLQTLSILLIPAGTITQCRELSKGNPAGFPPVSSSGVAKHPSRWPSASSG